MKKTMKLIAILLIAITLISFSSNVFADEIKPGDIKPTYSSTGTSDLQTKAKNIAGMIRNIAVIASVIILMILGVKYMLGSVEEKADYKKSMVPLIVGIVVVVSATSIASFIFGVVE